MGRRLAFSLGVEGLWNRGANVMLMGARAFVSVNFETNWIFFSQPFSIKVSEGKIPV